MICYSIHRSRKRQLDAVSDGFEKVARKDDTSRITPHESCYEHGCGTKGSLKLGILKELAVLKRTVGNPSTFYRAWFALLYLSPA
jgi:hypothetical protein